MSRRTQSARRPNPVKVGSHPDMLTSWSDAPFGTDVIADWRDCTPKELREAAEDGGITDEEYDEILAAEEQCDADGDIDAVVADGVNKALARALAGGFHAELLELDESNTERRAEPFIRYIREWMLGDLENEYVNGDGYNNIVDQFQTDLERGAEPVGRLVEAAREVSDACATRLDDGTLSEEALEPILRDPGNYNVELKTGHRSVDGSVWSYGCGVYYSEVEGLEHNDQLQAIVDGGNYSQHGWGPRNDAWDAGERDPRVLDGLRGGLPGNEIYPGLTEAALEYALKELENHDPWISIGRRGRRPLLKDLKSSFTMESSKYDDAYMHAVLDGAKLEEALNELEPETAAPRGAGADDVVHTYDGTNKSIAGVESEGCYVARLKVKDLRRESADLGHCIGSPANGHPQMLERGDTQVFSIRKADGKPKFTIELMKVATGSGMRRDAARAGFPGDVAGISAGRGPNGPHVWRIAECKGKANRLPGFAAEEGGAVRTSSSTTVMNKPGDVRMVCEFLLGLGFTPAQIEDCSDIAPGVAAMVDAGVSPFEPLKKKIRPHRDPRVQKPAENPRRNGRDTTPSDSEGSYPVNAHVAKLLRATKPMGAVSARSV